MIAIFIITTKKTILNVDQTTNYQYQVSGYRHWCKEVNLFLYNDFAVDGDEKGGSDECDGYDDVGADGDGDAQLVQSSLQHLVVPVNDAFHHMAAPTPILPYTSSRWKSATWNTKKKQSKLFLQQQLKLRKSLYKTR